MSFTVSIGCLLSLTVSPSALDLLYFSFSLIWYLAVSHCLSSPMELLHVSHRLFQFYEVAACHSLSLIVAGCLSLSLLVPWSYRVSVTALYVCLLSLTVCPSAIEFLHVSHFLLKLLAVSHCLSGPIELLHVSHCLLWLLVISHCLSECLGVTAYLSLSPIVFGCPSLSLRPHGNATCLSQSFLVPWNCRMSLTVYYCCWLSLPVPWSCCMSLTVCYGCWLSLTLSSVP